MLDFFFFFRLNIDPAYLGILWRDYHEGMIQKYFYIFKIIHEYFSLDFHNFFFCYKKLIRKPEEAIVFVFSLFYKANHQSLTILGLEITFNSYQLKIKFCFINFFEHYSTCFQNGPIVLSIVSFISVSLLENQFISLNLFGNKPFQ